MIHGKRVPKDFATASNISETGHPSAARTGFRYSPRTSLPLLAHSPPPVGAVLHDVKGNALLVDAVDAEVFLVEPDSRPISHHACAWVSRGNEFNEKLMSCRFHVDSIDVVRKKSPMDSCRSPG